MKFPRCGAVGKMSGVWSYPNGDALMHSRMELPFVYSQNAVMGVSFHFRLIFKTLRETKPYLVPLIYKASGSNDFFLNLKSLTNGVVVCPLLQLLLLTLKVMIIT